ncbi:uncharacterized protein DS421_9g280400 [Arachis hypogaea]|nr:uncharacterized protein DS421_9g280400 [Arachis hypogaea]
MSTSKGFSILGYSLFHLLVVPSTHTPKKKIKKKHTHTHMSDELNYFRFAF